MSATNIRIESEEDGFWLVIEHDERDITSVPGRSRVHIHAVAVDLLASVEREIAPWHREGQAVLAEMKRAGVFECNPSYEDFMAEEYRHARMRGEFAADEGYDASDPKHPDYHDAMADIWDSRDKAGA